MKTSEVLAKGLELAKKQLEPFRKLIEEAKMTDNTRKYMGFYDIPLGSTWTKGSNKVCTVVRKDRNIGKVFLKDETGKEIGVGYWDLQNQYFLVSV